jgi:CRISPR system Cascade subunit CasC
MNSNTETQNTLENTNQIDNKEFNKMTNTQYNRFDGKNIEMHLIYSTSVESRNRDEDGNPKSAVVGGVFRSRHSSQSKKKAMRDKPITIEECDVLKELGEAMIAPLYRSVNIPLVIFKKVEELSDHPITDTEKSDIGRWASEALSMLISGSDKKKKDDKKKPAKKKGEEEETAEAPEAEETTDEATTAKKTATEVKDEVWRTNGLLFLSDAELNAVAKVGMECKFKKIDKKKLAEIFNGSKFETIKDVLSCMDTALFGRMFADYPQGSVYGAASVSHAYTTHSAEPCTDFYVGTDTIDTGEHAGASFLGVNEFTSGTYYQYLSLNLGTLYNYLMKRTGNNDALSSRAVKLISKIYVQRALNEWQKGKENTFASYEACNYAKVLVRKGQQIQVNFEKPVRTYGEQGYEEKSVEELKKKIEVNKANMGSLYGEIMNADYGALYGGVGLDGLLSNLDEAIETINGSLN